VINPITCDGSLPNASSIDAFMSIAMGHSRLDSVNAQKVESPASNWALSFFSVRTIIEAANRNGDSND
jgi:hypothetical protein